MDSEMKYRSDASKHNDALFDRFYEDFENNALPAIPEPTDLELEAARAERESKLSSTYRSADSVDIYKLEVNNSIPVEVEIWVDKIFKIYFGELMPLLGLVHQCDRVREELYNYKGYTWYTYSELYPDVLFD